MRQMRWWIVGLVTDLAVLYNLERLDVGGGHPVDFQVLLYILVLAAVACTIAVPAFGRRPLVASLGLWSGIYVLGRLAWPADRPLLERAPVYLLIAELALLGISVLLAYEVARALHRFEEAVEQVTLPDPQRWVVLLKDAADAIATEINRSRRYERPLTVVVVKPEAQSIPLILQHMVQEVQHKIATHYAIVSLGRMLKITLRRTDLVLLEDRERNRFIILCPETGREAAETLADRVQRAAPEQLGFDVACGIAGFPDEALTFDEVTRLAEAKMRSASNAAPAAE